MASSVRAAAPPRADPAPAMLRVMLVDDHQLVRDGLRSVLERQVDFDVVAEAASADEAVRMAHKARPDVVVMDVRLGGKSGIEATREIRSVRPRTRVLMLTSFADDEALYASVLAGASGFVLKQVRLDSLLRAIRAVGSGENLISTEEVQTVMTRLNRGKHMYADSRLESLTPQEDRVLGLIAEGRTNREIAVELGLAEKTVKNYLSNILSKLEVQRRAQAAAYLARHTGSQG